MICADYVKRRQNEVNLPTVPNLHGKVDLVTGANEGIGKVAAPILDRQGAKVYVL